MRHVLLLAACAAILLSPGAAQAQTALWADVAPSSLGPSDLPTLPQAFRTVALDRGQMATRLAGAPDRDLSRGVTMPIPLPGGGMVDIRVAEASILAPALQARYPEIRTYLAQGPGAIHGRLSQTPQGFRAMLFTPQGTVYVDPYTQGDAQHYVVYYSSDLVVDPALRGRIADEVIRVSDAPPRGDRGSFGPHGATLRTYRLAVAGNGEYTTFHGGTVALGLAAIVTTINRVTGIYERDLSVSFELVANNNLIVYTNPATDPYSNSSASINENQTNLDAVIGTANYDVGHVFTTGSGGLAGLGVICNAGNKARGTTGLGSPVGDAFDVDYVAHELGHQFAGNHTFNGDSGSCSGGNRNGSTAYEPGSGSTIQAYAGICGNDNLQSNSDAYFHGVSLDEMTAHVTTGSGSTCGTTTSTGNPIPAVSVPGNVTIPTDTPFMLTGSATDDTPGALTYTWEEFDLGPQADVNAGTVPLFRSFLPTTEGSTRVFPQLGPLLAGQPPVVGETLPTAADTYTFRLTARDNNPGAGAINDASVDVTTVDTGAPFAVTFATTPGQIYTPGNATVTWNVAGTDGGAINTPTVDILLATDGETFDTALASATANDGSQTVTFPAVSTTDARIMIRAVGNIFFNVNPEPFTITNDDPPMIAVAPGSISQTVPLGGSASEVVTVSNTAAPGSLDLSWSVDVVTDAALLQRQAPDTRILPKGSDADAGTGSASFGLGGPDAFGYTWVDSDEASGPAVDFQDISGTGTAVTFTAQGGFPSSDEGYADVALPFTFPFYGTGRTSVRVFTNGFVTFEALTGTTFSNGGFPNTATPNTVIAPFWDDLDGGTSGTVYTGTLPDGRFVVQYDEVVRYNTTATMTFQAILSSDGSIEIQYGTMNGTLTSSTVGIENDGGTIGLQLASNSAYVASDKAVLFTAPTPPFVSVAPASGTVAAGEDDTFTVSLSAGDRPEGVYTADLVVSSNDPTTPTVTLPVTLTIGEDGGVSLVVDGPFGYRYLGAPSVGVTVDDLAAQNMVRGVPGYYPGALPANLHTNYNPVSGQWIPSAGTGQVLQIGRAFRWLMYDRVAGNPAISQSVELPFTLSTDLPANTADVDVTLNTNGDRFNFLANPFGTTLDLTGINGWPGGTNIVPTIWAYNPVTRRWDFNPTSAAPWEGFRVRSRPTAANPRVITIPASAAVTSVAARTASARTSSAQTAPAGLSFTLTGRDTDGLEVGDGALFVAFSDAARAAFDADEDVEKFQVPAASYALIGARAGSAFLGLDARPFAAAEIPLAVEARGTETRFTLRWDADALPAGLPVVLVDLATGREIDVRTSSSVTFDVSRTLAPFGDELPSGDFADGSSATDRFVLRIGSPAMAEAAVTEVELSAIAPNPSAGSARVSFGVPEAGVVRVSVYDVRGRQVAVLADGPLGAGRHEATLDSGSLAAGVYVVRLEAAGTVVTRQAIIVR